MKQTITKIILGVVFLLCAGCSVMSSDGIKTSYCSSHETTRSTLYEYSSIKKQDFHIEVASLLYKDLTKAYFHSFFYQVGFYDKDTKTLLLFITNFNNNTLMMVSFFNTEADYLAMFGGPLPTNLALGLLKESKFITLPYSSLLQGNLSFEAFQEVLNDLKYETN